MIFFLGKKLDIYESSLSSLNDINELKRVVKDKVKILKETCSNNLKFYLVKDRRYLFDLEEIKRFFCKEINIIYLPIVCNCH